MARYRLLAYCKKCSRLDRMDKIVKLADGPTDLQSIGDAYKGKILPIHRTDGAGQETQSWGNFSACICTVLGPTG